MEIDLHDLLKMHESDFYKDVIVKCRDKTEKHASLCVVIMLNRICYLLGKNKLHLILKMYVI